MQVVGASRIFICDKDFQILHNQAIAYDEKIREIGDFVTLKKKYNHGIFYDDCVLLPTFCNPHVHFEFSNNSTNFLYGGFDIWLDSVMQNRDAVLKDQHLMLEDSILETLKSGVGSVGAISSYGEDMHALAQSPLKVVYFNEVIGSNPSAVDFLYGNFLQRLEQSKTLSSQTFFPAIALHSPYSVHFILAKKVLEIARKENLKTSVHFLESHQERQWLEESKGYFKTFYEQTLQIKDPKSLYQIKDFLALFEGLDTLFVHCLFAKEAEIKQMLKTGSIVTCPRSNRLLNNKLLDLDALALEKISIATDGKSSNNNLNFLEELRCGLFGYAHKNCLEFSKDLLLSATYFGAKALRLNNGIIAKNYDADFSVFHIKNIKQSSQEALQFLLHATEAKTLTINGKTIF